MLFRDNGDHDTEMLWADGLTLLAADGIQVIENVFANNSDIGLIAGGARDALFAGSQIIQNTQAVFGAFMLANFQETTTSDFTGLVMISSSSQAIGVDSVMGQWSTGFLYAEAEPMNT